VLAKKISAKITSQNSLQSLEFFFLKQQRDCKWNFFCL
jgi:hypothetical protein